METVFLSKFSKDLDKLKNANVKKRLLNVIVQVENATTLGEVQNVKKLKGFYNAFRIKIGDYRCGIYVKGNTVEFARFLHRKDIYSLFP